MWSCVFHSIRCYGALDNFLDAETALLVNYSAVLNMGGCVMNMSLVEL